MNVISAGGKFQIYGEEVKFYNELPNGTYEIQFNKFVGFYLTEHNELEVKEDKIYGNTETKVEKILRSFSIANRNFGVILSGPKGVGKSLFARTLARRSNAEGLPFIICSNYVPGIANFISSIEQEVIVFFDEFEKTFAASEEVKPQEEMLSLFDGVDNGKKLFVITCNEVRQLNDFLLNRPGRFHYHFTLTTPTPMEIAAYMKDKLLPQYQDQIQKVVNFSLGGNLTYDCLRAIAFELNNGYSLEETVEDLNISREKYIRFDIHVEFEDGGLAIARRMDVDFYKEEFFQWIYDDHVSFSISFKTSEIHYNPDQTRYTLDPSKVKIEYDADDIPKGQEEFYENRKVKNVNLYKCKDDFVLKYVV